jgi:hypothetical protein
LLSFDLIPNCFVRSFICALLAQCLLFALLHNLLRRLSLMRSRLLALSEHSSHVSDCAAGGSSVLVKLLRPPTRLYCMRLLYVFMAHVKQQI